jgi:hypothetical protein
MQLGLVCPPGGHMEKVHISSADTDFWNLWKAASDETVGNAIRTLLELVDEHEFRCAVINGMKESDISSALIEERTFDTIMRHLAKRSGENFSITLRSAPRQQRRHGTEKIVEFKHKQRPSRSRPKATRQSHG